MACERFRDALTDVAAGAGPAPGVEAHLAGCEACRLELVALRGALALVDAELAERLAAEPSPELAARIRSALAESAQARPGLGIGWRLAIAGAGAALIAAAAYVAQRGSPPAPAVTAATTRSEPAAGVSRPPAAFAPDAVSREPASRAPARRVEPEVLVPAGEAEALLRFAASLRLRSVPPDSLLVADLSSPLTEPKDVVIHPLQIAPLDPAEASGTD